MNRTRSDFAGAADPASTRRPLAMGRDGAVAAGHHLATTAGFEIMNRGGNAVDAGVAAGVCINVLLFDRTSFGGVAPTIIYNAPSREVVTLDGLGVWPRRTDIRELQQMGGDQVADGIMRTITPAAPDSWMTALRLYGTMTLGEVLEPARDLAYRGAPVGHTVARSLARRAEDLDSVDAAAREIYFPGRRAPRPGQVLVQEDLGSLFKTLMDVEARARKSGLDREAAIEAARDHFYRGPIAEQIDAFYRRQGGWLRADDLAEHAVELAPPVTGTYHGYDIYTCNTWCQGPMLIQFLNILEQFDLSTMQPGSPAYLHLLLETMDLVFADRENFYADPRAVNVPMAGLMSKEYARLRAETIDPKRASGSMPSPGDPFAFEPDRDGWKYALVDPDHYIAEDEAVKSDTSYVTAADAEGNIFSATPSDPVFWTPIVPGLGMSMSGRGVQSRTLEGHPSSVAPGRRPRLTPNPALIGIGGRGLMGIGCPGGDAQTQGMLQVLLNMLHFGMNPQEAIEAPRVTSQNFPNSFAPHAYYPGRVDVEARVSPDAVRQLNQLGHRVQLVGDWYPGASSVHVSAINPSNGVILAGSDPRNEGSAISW